jgi:adenylate cyclase
MVQINFLNDNKTIKSESTASLLDISLQNGIPHVHVCGGKARCSTCRVIVLDGEENVLPRNEAEEKLARKKGFECNIRLACQTRVKGDVTVRRLVMDDEDIYLAAKHHGSTTGKEQQLAVLFSDIRSFTSFSETNLAYDVIHMLNRYFYEIGEVILQYDGFIDKYMGDGIMCCSDWKKTIHRSFV